MSTTEEIDELLAVIIAEQDPVVRNRLITRCYAELATAMAGVIGTRDLNWFAFGAWASGTAGAVIRRENLPLGIDLGTSGSVAAGNLAIITDVAPAALAWLRQLDHEGGPSPEALARALEDPLFAQAPKLADAIRAYAAAALLASPAPDPVADQTAAQLVLLANLRMGEHEQGIVDSFIDAAMPLGGPFGLITTRFVAITTPDGDLDVCRDVVAPSYLGTGLFPAVLDELVHPDLVAACAAYGQSTGRDSSASNALIWEDFDDRMGYILTFFRAYQRDARFFDVPSSFLP